MRDRRLIVSLQLESRPPRQYSTTPPSPDPFAFQQQPPTLYPSFSPSFNQQALVQPSFPNYEYQTHDFQPPLTAELFPQPSPSFQPHYLGHSRTSSGTGSPGPLTSGEFGIPSLQFTPQAQYQSHDPLTGANSSPLWDFHPTLAGEAAWWENEDLTPQWRQTLLDIYLPHRHQQFFSIHVPSFVMAVQSPTVPYAARPHPALMNAIYLLATHFAAPGCLHHVDMLESLFLERALAHVSNALENSDRLVNIVQASCLLACWFFGKGRLLEGYYHASSAGRLAIGLGIHQIRSDSLSHNGSSPTMKTQQDGIIASPMTRMEIGERITTFWQVYCIDRCWAVTTNLPPGLVDDEHPRTKILTVWPKEVEAYMDVSILRLSSYTFLT